jgi:DNA polymerase theta
MIQALQENAGRFASMVSAFCQRLGWNDLEGLVSKFQNRVLLELGQRLQN